MAKNKVQFQKSISIHEFIEAFGKEEQCLAHLHQLRWPDGFRCPHCGHDKGCRLSQRPVYQCACCRHQASVTANTIFAYSKLPLTKWFLAIYLITQEKNGISALELSRQIGVSYNAAWRLKHKLMQVMKEQDDRRPLEGYIQLDDVYWGGRRRGSKGREAKGKRPFVAALALNEEGHPVKMRLSAVAGFRSNELTRWTQHHIRPESLVISDGLACFRHVEAAKSFHLRIVTGGGPDSVELPYFKWVNTMIGNVKNAMHGTYHAIRLKHLPRYLAEFSYKFNRRFELAAMPDRLIRAAVKAPPMPDRLLKMAEPQW
ncbi:IS1595 family transposase [Vibrio parahaemolyticus]|uniref:IS1595 family transposase n=1 Tax=Vibrio parahaemolyticus TaxID=670 RepID=UPI003AAC7205